MWVGVFCPVEIDANCGPKTKPGQKLKASHARRADRERHELWRTQARQPGLRLLSTDQQRQAIGRAAFHWWRETGGPLTAVRDAGRIAPRFPGSPCAMIRMELHKFRFLPHF